MGRLLLLGVAATAAVFAACTSPTLPGKPGGGGGYINTTSSTTTSTSTSTTTTTTSTTTSTSTSTTTSTSTSTGTGGVPNNCYDTGFEPNEGENTAFDLGDLTDCDGTGSSLVGTIDGGNDLDWYFYVGDDTTGCSVDPSRNFGGGAGLRVCAFFECTDTGAALALSCPSDTTAATSPLGRDGCCGAASWSFDPWGFSSDVGCTGTLDDRLQVYIRVDEPGADASTCNDYTLDYHF
ncbi:MAG: hypothetical protein HY908_36845 [Myxococcales bacterium]|nr:hypothetical protein [Myxococcales bacterium]MCC6524553.1 hypothetical protein [Polyangiaceae bacterium]